MDHEKWLEQHDRMMADHEMMMVRHHEAIARHDIEMAELRVNQAKTENILRRAVRLAVQDARRQRKRNQEFDEIMMQIASAQRANEQLLKAFLERGGNGKP
jgi:hypothetical protein